MILSVKNLHAGYGAIKILHGISFDMEKGQIISFVGPNGAGKSTLMKVLSGLIKPTEGTVSLFEQQIQGKKAYELVTIGLNLVPEGRMVFFDMSVKENLEMGAVTEKSQAEIKKRMENVFQTFPKLEERQKQLAGTLSGGEQQMLAIGRGLMANPKLLLLDEPSLGLAPIIVSEVYRAVKHIQENTGISILLVEQNAKIALKVSDYAYVIENGRIALEGTSAGLADNPAFKEAYFGGK